MIPHKPKGTLWESSGCGYRELGGPLWLHSDLLCDLGQARFPFCLPSAKCGYRRLLLTGLTEVLRKKPCLLGKYHFPGARSCENLCRSSQSVKGRLSFQVWVCYQVPLPICMGREKGMSELSGGGGDRWSLAEQEESANQRRSGSSIRTQSRWVWGSQEGHFPVHSVCDSELVAFREPEGPPTSFPFFEEGL